MENEEVTRPSSRKFKTITVSVQYRVLTAGGTRVELHEGEPVDV